MKIKYDYQFNDFVVVTKNKAYNDSISSTTIISTDDYIIFCIRTFDEKKDCWI